MTHTFARRKLLLRVTQSGAGKKATEVRRAVVKVGSFDELLRQMKRLQRHRKPHSIMVFTSRKGDHKEPDYFQKQADHIYFQLRFGGYRQVRAKLSPRMFPLAMAWIQDTKPFGGLGQGMAFTGSAW